MGIKRNAIATTISRNSPKTSSRFRLRDGFVGVVELFSRRERLVLHQTRCPLLSFSHVACWVFRACFGVSLEFGSVGCGRLVCRGGRMVARVRWTKRKLYRASGECLGTMCRRRTCQATKRGREWQAHCDLPISEWGNPAVVMRSH